MPGYWPSQPGTVPYARNTPDTPFCQHPVGVILAKTDILARAVVSMSPCSGQDVLVWQCARCGGVPGGMGWWGGASLGGYPWYGSGVAKQWVLQPKQWFYSQNSGFYSQNSGFIAKTAQKQWFLQPKQPKTVVLTAQTVVLRPRQWFYGQAEVPGGGQAEALVGPVLGLFSGGSRGLRN